MKLDSKATMYDNNIDDSNLYHLDISWALSGKMSPFYKHTDTHIMYTVPYTTLRCNGEAPIKHNVKCYRIGN